MELRTSDGEKEASTQFGITVGGTSNVELFLSVGGPIVGILGVGGAWISKRGLLMNRFNRKHYDKGTTEVEVGVPFTIPLTNDVNKAQKIRTYKGKTLVGGFAVPRSLESFEWLKRDQPIPGGLPLPGWLVFDSGKSELFCKEGVPNEHRGEYIIRLIANAEIILEEHRLVVGSSSGSTPGKDVEMNAF